MSQREKSQREQFADREKDSREALRSLTPQECNLLDDWLRDPQGLQRALTLLKCYEDAVRT